MALFHSGTTSTAAFPAQRKNWSEHWPNRPTTPSRNRDGVVFCLTPSQNLSFREVGVGPNRKTGG